jgi:photosystem II stability/assembly factor-like uncharacterized protein
MDNKIKNFDRIILTVDLPQEGLTVGDVGVVVDTYEGGKVFEVEFMTLDGSNTIAVVTLESSQVRAISARMLMHARAF